MSASISNYLTSQSTTTSQLSSTASSSASGTSSDLASGASSLNTSYQTFLTLLTTQLKNQDPSSPMDPDQFTTELVQMTGVQQQLLSNQLLQQLVNASPSQGVTSAVDLIGQNVSASTPSATLSNGSATWDYTLPSSVAKATVTVTDSTGEVVYTEGRPQLRLRRPQFHLERRDHQRNSGAQRRNLHPDHVGDRHQRRRRIAHHRRQRHGHQRPDDGGRHHRHGRRRACARLQHQLGRRLLVGRRHPIALEQSAPPAKRAPQKPQTPRSQTT